MTTCVRSEHIDSIRERFYVILSTGRSSIQHRGDHRIAARTFQLALSHLKWTKADIEDISRYSMSPMPYFYFAYICPRCLSCLHRAVTPGMHADGAFSSARQREVIVKTFQN